MFLTTQTDDNDKLILIIKPACFKLAITITITIQFDY